MRIFIALLLPEQIKTALQNSAEKIKPYCNKGNFTKPDNYHLTLRFLGECTEKQVLELQKVIETLAADTSRFRLSLNDCGSFHKGSQQIIWQGLKQPFPELKILAQQLDSSLAQHGWPKEKRSFAPHITLIRQAVLTKPLEQICTKESHLSFQAQQIAVMESCSIEGQLTYIPLAISSFK